MKLDDIIIIDNIVPQILQDELESFHISPLFPWHYVKDTVSNVDYKFKKQTIHLKLPFSIIYILKIIK